MDDETVTKFILAVQELKTSVRWIVAIGGGIFTLLGVAAGMLGGFIIEANKSHAATQVNTEAIRYIMEGKVVGKDEVPATR